MPEACIVCDGKASDLQELHDILNSASPVAFRVRRRLGTVAVTDPDDSRLLALAEQAARRAGRLLLERFGQPATGVDRKSSATDMVSDADREAEQAIRDLLRRERPADAVLGEERGATRGDGGLLWVVDPLDGTTNYLYRHPIWSVSIACEDDRGARVGVVHHPSIGETFTAVRGGGALLDGAPIGASDATDLSRSLIGTGFGYRAEVRAEQARALAEILPCVRDVRRGGSAAIDLCWVACGRLDGFYELGVQRWDTAAGVLIAREAGAVVTPLQPVGVAEAGVLAAAPGVHDALTSLVGPALLH
jgi:myo-inositol-1(or 4)-monophosphatase